MAVSIQEISVTPAYRSGAVARLTGIPVETLRVWERRYKVVGPRQSATGQRQYAPEEVTRLSVIKRLVDAGYAIGSIAALDLEQLQSMLQQASRAPMKALRPPLRPLRTQCSRCAWRLSAKRLRCAYSGTPCPRCRL